MSFTVEKLLTILRNGAQQYLRLNKQDTSEAEIAKNIIKMSVYFLEKNAQIPLDIKDAMLLFTTVVQLAVDMNTLAQGYVMAARGQSLDHWRVRAARAFLPENLLFSCLLQEFERAPSSADVKKDTVETEAKKPNININHDPNFVSFYEGNSTNKVAAKNIIKNYLRGQAKGVNEDVAIMQLFLSVFSLPPNVFKQHAESIIKLRKTEDSKDSLPQSIIDDIGRFWRYVRMEQHGPSTELLQKRRIAVIMDVCKEFENFSFQQIINIFTEIFTKLHIEIQNNIEQQKITIDQLQLRHCVTTDSKAARDNEIKAIGANLESKKRRLDAVQHISEVINLIKQHDHVLNDVAILLLYLVLEKSSYAKEIKKESSYISVSRVPSADSRPVFTWRSNFNFEKIADSVLRVKYQCYKARMVYEYDWVEDLDNLEIEFEQNINFLWLKLLSREGLVKQVDVDQVVAELCEKIKNAHAVSAKDMLAAFYEGVYKLMVAASNNTPYTDKIFHLLNSPNPAVAQPGAKEDSKQEEKYISPSSSSSSASFSSSSLSLPSSSSSSSTSVSGTTLPTNIVNQQPAQYIVNPGSSSASFFASSSSSGSGSSFLASASFSSTGSSSSSSLSSEQVAEDTSLSSASASSSLSSSSTSSSVPSVTYP